jgi:hypothetical protein
MDIMSPVHRDPIWLALTDEAVEGKWMFTAGPESGTDVSDLVPWSSGEPNGGTRENCGVHWPGSMNVGDVSCLTERLKYIVEFECPFGQRFNDQGTACIGTMIACLLILSCRSDSFVVCADVNFVCENSFEGGGWLQVRFISASPEKWHRAQDGLRGTDVYGYPGLSEYSIYFKDLMKTNDQLLFVLGMQGWLAVCMTRNLICTS